MRPTNACTLLAMLAVTGLGCATSGGGSGSKTLASTQVPPPPECGGYQVRTQLADDAVKISFAKGAPIVELVYKKIAGASSTYELQAITPPEKVTDPGPPATASVVGGKVCFAWSADDSSTDPCLAAVQHAEWCVQTAPQ